MGDLAFEVGPNRVLLSGKDAADLDGWFWSDRLAREQLHEPLKRALASGEDVIVRDEHVRISLLRILDLMDEGGFIVTPGLRRLHETARLPISGG